MLTLKHGTLFSKGLKVGSMTAQGQYQVTDARGQVHAGNIATLLKATIRARLASAVGRMGRLRVGVSTYEVRKGVAFSDGRPVGTVSVSGEYVLERFGQRSEGHVDRTPGAVWLSLTPGGGSGRIEIGGKRFTAINGAIYDAGEEIGWLADDGRFRGVTIEGDHFEGSLNALDDAMYLRFVEAPPKEVSEALIG